MSGLKAVAGFLAAPIGSRDSRVAPSARNKSRQLASACPAAAGKQSQNVSDWTRPRGRHGTLKIEDAELQRELETLVADHFRAGDFLEIPPAIIGLPSADERPGTVVRSAGARASSRICLWWLERAVGIGYARTA